MNALLFVVLLAQPTEGGVRLTPPDFELPPTKSWVLVSSGAPGPGEKDARPAASMEDLKQELRPKQPGDYALWWLPKAGRPVRVVEKVTVRERGTVTVALGDHLGALRLRGEGLPRVSQIALTELGGPGPDESDFAPVQTVAGFGEDLVVPGGDYALWIKPANGAPAKRLESRIRVQAGKLAVID